MHVLFFSEALIVLFVRVAWLMLRVDVSRSCIVLPYTHGSGYAYCVLQLATFSQLLCKRPSHSSFAPHYAAHLQMAVYSNAVLGACHELGSWLYRCLQVTYSPQQSDLARRVRPMAVRMVT